VRPGIPVRDCGAIKTPWLHGTGAGQIVNRLGLFA